MSSNPAQIRAAVTLGAPAADAQTGAPLATDALSLPVRLDGRGVAGVSVPEGWTGATLTFQVADADPNGREGNVSPEDAARLLRFCDLYGADGREVCVPAAPGCFVALPPGGPLAAGFGWLRVRSGTAASPVPQGAPVALALFLRYFH